jgi:CheY-like chemotaxis protein
MSSSRSLSILLVEDNVANQLVATAYLARAGHRIDVASNGLEAIDRFHASNYDLVLMDLQMPAINGLECARLIRTGKHNSSVPIFAMTANVLRREQRRCRDAGMNAYFAKPIVWDELLDRISKLDDAA